MRKAAKGLAWWIFVAMFFVALGLEPVWLSALILIAGSVAIAALLGGEDFE